MPEGPECRIIAEGLGRALIGNRVLDFAVVSGRYLKRPIVALEAFRRFLPLTCEGVGVKGKFIWLEFGHPNVEGECISAWSTLGMSGTWLKAPGDHTRLRIDHDGGSLYFNDPRNFGTLTLAFIRDAIERKLSVLGLDPLNDVVGPDDFRARIRRRKHLRRTLAEVLMDQTCLAGVGNYILAEALWHSELSPHRLISSLSDVELERLLASVTHVMSSAYRARGHTMSDYRDVEGAVGAAGFELRCYGRRTDPDGLEVVREARKDGRMTHWVPGRQH